MATRASRITAGIVLALAVLYFIVEVVVAHAWTRPYSITEDSISNLGVTSCTPALCSPMHSLMNATFIGLGVLIVAGALLLQHNIESARLRVWILALALVTGISTAATGVVPSNLGSGYHALAVIPGFLCRHPVLILVAVAMRHTYRLIAIWSAVCAATGLIGAALIASPIGFGITERITLYPFTIWMAVTGVLLLFSSRKAAVPPRDHRT